MIPREIDSISKLEEFCGARLDDFHVTCGPEISARFALELCALFFESLSSIQRDAVSQARLFWSGQKAPGFEEAMDALAKEPYAASGGHSRPEVVARRRLVSAAMNKVTPFDAISCGYLMAWARDAGVQLPDLVDVMSKIDAFR